LTKYVYGWISLESIFHGKQQRKAEVAMVGLYGLRTQRPMTLISQCRPINAKSGRMISFAKYVQPTTIDGVRPSDFVKGSI